MKIQKKDAIIALFFLAIYLIVSIRNIAYSYVPTTSFLWFCDVAPLVLAIAFLSKKTQLIKSIINVGLITQFITVLDFIVFIFTKSSLTGSEILATTPAAYIIVFLIAHVIPMNAALIFTYREKTEKISVLYSLIGLTILYFVTILFSVPVDNINAVYYLPLFVSVSIPFYWVVWLLISLLIFILPTYYLQKYLYERSKKYRH